jgi:hypothetical protein
VWVPGPGLVLACTSARVGQHRFLLGENAGVVDPLGEIGACETRAETEAPRARLAAGLLCAYSLVVHPPGVCCFRVRDAGERWTCALKMLAQMASTSPS